MIINNRKKIQSEVPSQVYKDEWDRIFDSKAKIEEANKLITEIEDSLKDLVDSCKNNKSKDQTSK